MRATRGIHWAGLLLTISACGGSARDEPPVDAAGGVAGTDAVAGRPSGDDGAAGRFGSAGGAGFGTPGAAGEAVSGAGALEAAAGEGGMAGESASVAGSAGEHPSAGSAGISGNPGGGAAANSCAEVGGANGAGGSSSAAFSGLWDSSGKGTWQDSCAGPGQEASPFVMRLRGTQNAGLQFVEIDQNNLQTEVCVLDFSLSGNVATLSGEQECLPGTPAVRRFLCDRLEFVNGVIHEHGLLQHPAGGASCSLSFDYSYTAHP